jgi:hypothetical protein
MDGSRTLLTVRPLRRVLFHFLIVVELWRERIFELRLGHWGVRADRFSRDRLADARRLEEMIAIKSS